jgi:hypothetical protein
VVQGGRSASFALEAFERRRIFGEIRSEKFQSHLAAETRIFGPKNLAHAAASEGIDDAVVRNCFANHLWVESIVNKLRKPRKTRRRLGFWTLTGGEWRANPMRSQRQRNLAAMAIF